MTPLELAILKKGAALGASVVKDKILEVLARNDLAAARASQEIDAEILFEAAWRAKQTEARLDEVEGRLVAHIVDREHARIRLNYVLEATREALDERYGMLISAAAETLLSSLPSAEKSRVERVLRELDPADVRELRAIRNAKPAADNTVGPNGRWVIPPGHENPDGLARREAFRVSPSRAELLAAACVEVDGTTAGDIGPVNVTRRGELVLEILRAW